MITTEEFFKNSCKTSSIEDLCSCGCGVAIKEHPDERHYFDGQQICGDCYFRLLGEHVDEQPICTPQVYD
jgi:hypothetical protein